MGKPTSVVGHSDISSSCVPLERFSSWLWSNVWSAEEARRIDYTPGGEGGARCWSSESLSRSCVTPTCCSTPLLANHPDTRCSSCYSLLLISYARYARCHHACHRWTVASSRDCHGFLSFAAAEIWHDEHHPPLSRLDEKHFFEVPATAVVADELALIFVKQSYGV